PSAEDIYISASQIRRFDLRNGDKVSGKVRPPKENERYYGLLHVDAVNGEDPETSKERVHCTALTPLYPDRTMQLEGKASTRVDGKWERSGNHKGTCPFSWSQTTLSRSIYEA